MYEKINRSGFTLIELIAVVVILGILSFIAVPAVSGYIDNSKKETYIRTLTSYVETVKYDVLKGKYELKNGDEIDVVFSSIQVDGGSNLKSPYGKYVNNYSYVTVIKNIDSTYTYKVQALDSSGRYIESIDIQLLSKSDILLADVNGELYVIPDVLVPNR